MDVVGDGREGFAWAQASDYDLIVLDLMLPSLDGLALLKKLREAGKETHVLILTAKDTVEDRVRGLQTGADDYLVKPFAFDELLARVQALLRRRHGRKNPLIRIRHLEIDTSARAVVVAGDAVNLAPREYALLEYLARRQGAVVSRRYRTAHLRRHGGSREQRRRFGDLRLAEENRHSGRTVAGANSPRHGLRSSSGGKLMSIRRKLILGLLLGLMALLVVSGTILYSYMNTVLKGRFNVALTAEAHVVCGLVRLPARRRNRNQ